MAGVKKRTVNFTSDEKRILTKLVLKYQNIVENKRTDATTNKDKILGWMRIADQFNNISTHCNQTHDSLKCCWENIKRQAKKDRAEVKKKIFMTGGGKPPTPPSNGEPSSVVGAILGPALEGIVNIYDSDAMVDEYIVLENKAEDGTVSGSVGMSKENKEKPGGEFGEMMDKMEDGTVSGSVGMSKENKERPGGEFGEMMDISTTKEPVASTSKQEDTWTSWTPKDLKTPISGALKVPKDNSGEWLKRRRPKNDNASDMLMQEKIELVKILKENAIKESKIRLSILEEQLKQEKIKTEKLMISN